VDIAPYEKSYKKAVDVDGHNMTLSIFDFNAVGPCLLTVPLTRCQDETASPRSRAAELRPHGALIVYDVTQHRSFDMLAATGQYITSLRSGPLVRS
jgi:hypothetical protein